MNVTAARELDANTRVLPPRPLDVVADTAKMFAQAIFFAGPNSREHSQGLGRHDNDSTATRMMNQLSLQMGKAALSAVTLFSACDYSHPPPPPANVQQPPTSQTGFVESTGARLSYRLDLPPRDGKVPAVVIGHGSGRVTKDACRYLATGFLSRGFATLCYDKRGVGESTGEYSSVGPRNSERMFDLLGEDMAAGVRFLRAHDAIDASRVGLVGGSQAGWIIPVAAARVRPAFMILLVGPAVSVGEEIFYSDIVEKTAAPLEDGYEKLPAFSGNRGFDPRPLLATLDVPGLWLLGAKDRSIPTPETVAILKRLAEQGRRFSHVVFPDAGHDLSGTPYWEEIDRWLALTLPPRFEQRR